MGRPPGALISSKRRSACSDSPAAESALMAAVYLSGVRVGVGVRVGARVGVRGRVSDGCGVQPRVPRHAALAHLVEQIAHLIRRCSDGDVA